MQLFVNSCRGIAVAGAFLIALASSAYAQIQVDLTASGTDPYAYFASKNLTPIDGPSSGYIFDTGSSFNFVLHQDGAEETVSSGAVRQRNELTVNPGNPDNYKGHENETMSYTWRFRLNTMNAVPTWCDCFQIKPHGTLGVAPFVALQCDNDKLFIESDTIGDVASVPISSILGVWVNASITITYKTSGGSWNMSLKKDDGTTVMGYNATNVVTWNSSLDFVRPKWGLYRNKAAGAGEASIEYNHMTIIRGTITTVANPVFTPAGGTFTGTQTVSISSTTSSASVRYTTNGTTPTPTTGTLYSGPITIASTTTLKAIAYKAGMNNSSVTSATYTINSSSGGTTLTSADGFFNRSLGSSQSGSFSVDFDASASLSPSNTTYSLCQGAQTAYTGVAATVRFSTTGVIDARNGGAYAAVNSFAFSANTTYHFHLDVNVTSHTYSATVTAPSGSPVTIASNYAFRTEQAGVTALDTFNVDVNATPGGSTTFGATTVTTAASPVKFSIPGTSVIDSSDDGNVAANAVDGSLATRWSASGDGQWIRFDIGSTKTVKLVKVAFYSGDTRTSTFDVQVSSDGTNFTTVHSYTSSGTTLSLETFDIADTSARYVRLLGHGNSVNLWNSYTEVEVWGN
jgi:hypothetical protein